MTFETADDVLEHFGVKGMKWGVRKKSSSGGGQSGGKEKKTSKKKRAAQVAVVVGVIVAGAIIANRGGVSTNSLRGSSFHRPVSSPRLGSSVANPLRVASPRLGSRVADPFAAVNARITNQGRVATQETLRRIGNERFSAIPMPPVRTPAPSRPRVRGSSGDAAALRSSIATLIRGANADLRARDNALNIPFNQRSYLTEWDS